MCYLIETDKPEGKLKVPILPRYNILIITVFASVIFMVVLAFPIIEQTHIHVEIAQNKISDVWVETPRVSLISTIIPPPERKGINTINIAIPKTGESFELIDVPSGEYIIIWVTNGVPATDTYTIKVELFQNDTLMDTFDLEVSF